MTASLSVGCFAAQVALINAGNVPSAFSPTITASRVVTAKKITGWIFYGKRTVQELMYSKWTDFSA